MIICRHAADASSAAGALDSVPVGLAGSVVVAAVAAAAAAAAAAEVAVGLSRVEAGAGPRAARSLQMRSSHATRRWKSAARCALCMRRDAVSHRSAAAAASSAQPELSPPGGGGCGGGSWIGSRSGSASLLGSKLLAGGAATLSLAPSRSCVPEAECGHH